MKLAKLCFAFFLALSSFGFSSIPPFQNTTEQIDTLNDNDEYTIVREYHDGLWWIVYYNEDGLKVMEVIDPWQ